MCCVPYTLRTRHAHVTRALRRLNTRVAHTLHTPALHAPVAQVVYEFWYGALCDVYLEAIKPIMQVMRSSA